MKPMKLTDVGTDISPYLGPEWVMQQKMDGARLVVIYDVGETSEQESILFTNDGEKEISFSAARLKLPALQEELLAGIRTLQLSHLVLDGELIIEDGVYYVFDVLHALLPHTGTMVSHRDAWRWRDEVLRTHLDSLQSDLVRFSATARTWEEKRILFDAIVEAGVEGAVSKHVDSLYVPGTRSKEWVKHKLVKAADVVVTAVERKFDEKGMVTHGSAALGVPIVPGQDPEPWVDRKTGKRRISHATLNEQQDKKQKSATDLGWEYFPRDTLPVGNASLIGKDLTIDVGSVVEVEYLYWTGQAMIQPRIVRKRDDKLASECDLDQFPEYTREAVSFS